MAKTTQLAPIGRRAMGGAIMRTLVVVALAGAGCASSKTTVIRDLGIGLVVEGGLVFGGAYVTRDHDEGVADALVTAAPLLAAGALVWVADKVLR
jgi:hypothetical protein